MLVRGLAVSMVIIMASLVLGWPSITDWFVSKTGTGGSREINLTKTVIYEGLASELS